MPYFFMMSNPSLHPAYYAPDVCRSVDFAGHSTVIYSGWFYYASANSSDSAEFFISCISVSIV